MKAMTLYQPWASLIAEGVKTIETRPKQHPWRSAIGETVAIHAAKGERWRHGERFGPWSAYRADGANAPGRMDSRLTRSNPDYRVAGGDRPDRSLLTIWLPLGAVVATCTLVDVVPIHDRWRDGEKPDGAYAMADGRVVLIEGPNPDDVSFRSDQVPFGDYAPGRWALLLDNIVKCEPFPCRGYQGLWTLPSHVADNLVGRCA